MFASIQWTLNALFEDHKRVSIVNEDAAIAFICSLNKAEPGLKHQACESLVEMFLPSMNSPEARLSIFFVLKVSLEYLHTLRVHTRAALFGQLPTPITSLVLNFQTSPARSFPAALPILHSSSFGHEVWTHESFERALRWARACGAGRAGDLRFCTN